MRHILLALALVPTSIQYAGHTVCFRDQPYVAVEPEQVKCLATTLYGEARSEDEIGILAVAHVIKNRSQSKSICDTVLAPKQFSIFNNNPALLAAAKSAIIEPMQKNTIDSASWAESMRVAGLVLGGKTADPTAGATHYIADRVMKLKGYKYPKWSRTFTHVATIGRHRFFKKPDRAA